MLFSPRIGQRELAAFCRRVAIAMESGIETRRIMEREAQGRAPPALRRQLEEVRQHVARGGTLSEAFTQRGNYFPALVREMVDVGEQSGKLPDVFLQLAEHYEQQLAMRRAFVAGITWPMLQLAAALAIVGLLIWLMGLIGAMTGGEPVDILGFGLIGTSGLLIYLGILGSVLLVAWLLWQAMRRGALWTRFPQRLVLSLPVLGKAVATLALARFAWSLHLTFGTGMSLLKAIPLSLRSTQNAYYIGQSAAVVEQVRRGVAFSDSLAFTEAFPEEFLEAVEVGERAGRLPEAMAVLSRQYHDQAQRALAALAVVAGFLVWALVAGLIVLLIFRLFSFYLGAINDAMDM